MAVLDYPGLSYFKGKYDEQVKGILNNIVADEYSSSATYAVGDYVLHDGKLYICKTAIATAEEWTAAHWTEVDISGEVKDLKSSLNAENSSVAFESGKYIDNNGLLNTGDGNDYYTAFIPVGKGNRIVCMTKGFNNTNAISFYSSADESDYVGGVANNSGYYAVAKYTAPLDGYVRFYANASSESQLAVVYAFVMNQPVNEISDNLSLCQENYKHLPFELVTGSWSGTTKYNTQTTARSQTQITLTGGISVKTINSTKATFDLIENSAVVRSINVVPADGDVVIQPGTYSVTVSIPGDARTAIDSRELYNNVLSKNTLLQKIDSNINAFKNKYRYLTVSFLNYPYFSADSMTILGTNDLKTFDLLAKKGVYSAQKSHTDGGNTARNAVRDPAVIKIGDYFYIAYTIITSVLGSVIGVCRTKDFTVFEELDNLTITSDGSAYTQIWSPSWFREGNNLYIVSTGIGNSGGVNFYETVVSAYDVSNHSVSTGTVLANVLGIDFHIYKYGDKYIAVGGTNKIYVSDTLTGEYSLVSNNLDGTGYEAAFLIKLDSGKYRLYRQEVEAARSQAMMIYQDADNPLAETWSNPTYVQYTPMAKSYAETVYGTPTPVGYYYHWTIHDFMDSNNNNNNYVD